MRFLFAASILFAATAASADAPKAAPARQAATPTAPTTAPDVKKMHTDDCARARAQNKTCVIDMGKDADIEGNAPGAGGIGIAVIEGTKAASLIHIRRDFIVEILKSAEDLQ